LPASRCTSMSEQETGVQPQAQTVSPAWERIERARHPQRPYPMELIERIFTDFSEIHGDRAFGDDEAVACGMARLPTPASKDRLPGTPDLGADEVMVIGNRKGGSTKERVRRNFGMPHPEGYRKALRAMKIAEKFGRPVITFIDLPGAFPGLGAEERGQAEAIARNLREMSRLRVPTIAVISGEGGSGGALALAVADRVLILENALYFVISPEGCASIMWNDASKKALAAEALRISAPEVAELGCVDEIIAEPQDGIHTDREAGTGVLGSILRKHLDELKSIPMDALVAARQKKFRNIAQFFTQN
jgi:acetyl-CoA carboxylase carboxyl transferase subunit alpha